ncbi:MAG: GNAT family N-acetyltransferase [Prevotellaceae bacterium]|jgi:ribosomal protein S18 acetylase RimI-like enzyme|nr:GNAT family N-acetyltransferase [Prevotellaceae bacterium]
MEIKSLSKVGFDAIFEAFNHAFADYELQLNKEQLQAMLKRRGFNSDLSFAAFDESDIVAFTLNGTGDFNGIPTAYDTGTGTLKEHRGKGLAAEIFKYSTPYLSEAGIKQYLLEVLQYNTGAVSVYRNLGFETIREFSYFVQKNEEISNKISLDSSFSAKHINIDDFISMSDFWDFYPSWQNSFESIERAAGGFVCLGVFTENKLIGYCVFEPVSGDITQLAVDKQYRRKGAASLLLHEMIKLNKNDAIKVIDTDVLCSSVTEFLKAKNIELKGKQFEMIKRL